MAYASLVGKNAKVTQGADNVLGMGNWSIGGGSVAALDDTEFGDEHQDLVLGLFTGGQVSFSGLYKVDDVSAQNELISAYYLRGAITDLRFFVNNTSYWIPNSTTLIGIHTPANSPISKIYITSEPQISMDRSGLGQISFSGVVVGVMRFI